MPSGEARERAIAALRFLDAGMPTHRGFFYHSGKERRIVGVVEVVKTVHPDSTDPEWECVDIAAVKPVPKQVTLEQVKSDKRLADMVLVNNSRLSVQPVTQKEYERVLEMAGGKA